MLCSTETSLQMVVLLAVPGMAVQSQALDAYIAPGPDARRRRALTRKRYDLGGQNAGRRVPALPKPIGVPRAVDRNYPVGGIGIDGMDRDAVDEPAFKRRKSSTALRHAASTPIPVFM